MEDVELYDRQIRLWGLDTQVNLGRVKLLVIEASELSCEVCKNLVLSGIGEISFLDDKVVSSSEGSLLFLERHLGAKKVKVITESLSEFNPKVKLNAIEVNPAFVSEEHIQNHDLVCFFSKDVELLLKINALTRANGKKFWAAQILGIYGYIFSDMIVHEYAKTPKQEVKYPSFFETLDIKGWAANLKNISRRKSRKTLHPAVLDIWVILMHLSNNSLKLESISDKNAHEVLYKYISDLITEQNLEHYKECLELLEPITHSWNEELPFMYSILGGYLAQDIIKVISKNSCTINNVFFFASTEFLGSEFRVPVQGLTKRVFNCQEGSLIQEG